ncbi:ABC-2 type transport system ATP-binding protein [Carnobacterium maltaromaticum]|uniref:ATP-binding cassette domain-containing protein n=1 Tax=Carnobacterium maltaromaticum TaxID=2751 RepID=UPI00191BB7C9|nr:ATP-binding cassette domain-containing protein [Carnobacterium maltaromaticum]CAD5900329.1 ABC-2 type transport system ATP-binding protein [Carnobacterium maltaromaticum]
MLKIVGLTVVYGGKEILKDLHFESIKPEIIGLVAPNGTGKTTLLKSLAGLIQPTLGRVEIQEYTIKEREKYLKNLFFIENVDSLNMNFTPIEYLNYVKSIWHSTIDCQMILTTLKMDNYKSMKLKRLSLGMKQHVLIAMALVSDAQIILLDEPMNGLDPTSLKIVSKCLLKLKQQGKVILFSSHILLNVDAIADRTFFIKNKSISYILDYQREGKTAQIIYDELYD